jgi:hypothetical protein
VVLEVKVRVLMALSMTMTPESLAKAVLPYARYAVKAARPMVVGVVGRPGWVLLWPAWAVVTGPLLPVLVRIGVELAVALTAPSLLPVLEALNRILTRVPGTYLAPADRAFVGELTQLLATPRAQLSVPVRDALDQPIDMLEGDC